MTPSLNASAKPAEAEARAEGTMRFHHNFVRDAAVTWWHDTCTSKMGRDAMSVVDGPLKVYGIDKLRIADGSILPGVTTGNTMAPSVVIGERAAELLKRG